MKDLLHAPEILDISERPKRLLGRRRIAYVAVSFVAALVLLTLNGALSLSQVNQATDLLLLISLGLAWNLISGFAGQFSLGHSIFIGLGGYVTAILLTKTGLPLLVVILLAAALAALVGVVLAYPMIRLRGPYFAIGTLALALAVIGWMLNWDLTNRSQAYPLPFAALPDVDGVYTLAAAVAIVCFFSAFLVMRTPLGLRVLALRDDEDGASSLGVRRTTTLLPMWALSAFLTGLVGAVYAVQKGTLDPHSAFSLQFTLDAIIVCIIGGLGTLNGPIVGGIVVYAMRQFAADYDSIAGLMEAITVIAFVRFAPEGIVPLVGRLWRSWRSREVTG